MTERDKLYHHILNYKKRIEEKKKKYGRWYPGARRMNSKITTWKQHIKRIERRDLEMRKLDNYLKEFLGFSVKDTCEKNSLKQPHELRLARKIFYKYGLENGLRGNWLARYVGAKDKATPSRGRLEFTRSFKTNRGNKEMWERFKSYLSENQISNIQTKKS